MVFIPAIKPRKGENNHSYAFSGRTRYFSVGAIPSQNRPAVVSLAVYRDADSDPKLVCF